MLPKPIYDLLPYLYLSIGLFSAFNVEVLTGRMSGVLLMAAGLIIWRLRYLYRQEWKKNQRNWKETGYF